MTGSDKVFCYHCRSFHFPDEVRLIQTGNGRRWRCVKSIVASRASRAQRDAFGKLVSEQNQTYRALRTAVNTPHCLVELMVTPLASPFHGIQDAA
jgi:hypothetical protein